MMKKRLASLASRKALKQKYYSLRNDIVKSQSQLEKTYKPITEPLRQLISSIQKTEHTVPKNEIIEPKSEIFSTPHLKSPRKVISQSTQSNIRSQPEFLADGDIFETSSEVHPEDHYMEDTARNILEYTTHPAFQDYLDAFATPLPRMYIEENIKDTEDLFDHRFGIYHDLETDKLTIGDSVITFEGPDLIIKGIRYIGTPGLYELLFKKNPIGHKKTDVDQYIDILKRTNAMHQKNDSTKPLKSATREIKDKFKFIIEPYFKPRQRTTTLPAMSLRNRKVSTTGKGLQMMDLNNKEMEYRYFDDYNELVDRLRLLVASQTAGNTSHNNEIISILEELREAKIIK